MAEERVNFGSKIGVILATAGSAVGLGNIWRFPYMTGENGGAAFILIYVDWLLRSAHRFPHNGLLCRCIGLVSQLYLRLNHG